MQPSKSHSRACGLLPPLFCIAVPGCGRHDLTRAFRNHLHPTLRPTLPSSFALTSCRPASSREKGETDTESEGEDEQIEDANVTSSRKDQ